MSYDDKIYKIIVNASDILICATDPFTYELKSVHKKSVYHKFKNKTSVLM